MCQHLIASFLKTKSLIDQNIYQIDKMPIICNNIHNLGKGKTTRMYEGAIEHAQFLARHFGKDKLQYAIGAVLFELKIPVKGAAFDYLKNAVIVSLGDPLIPMMKGLYPTVGMMYNPPIGYKLIEQSIRSAIITAWNERDDKVWGYYFQSDRNGNFKKPTNAEFIRGVMRFLILWQGCCGEEVICEK